MMSWVGCLLKDSEFLSYLQKIAKSFSKCVLFLQKGNLEQFSGQSCGTWNSNLELTLIITASWGKNLNFLIKYQGEDI